MQSASQILPHPPMQIHRTEGILSIKDSNKPKTIRETSAKLCISWLTLESWKAPHKL